MSCRNINEIELPYVKSTTSATPIIEDVDDTTLQTGFYKISTKTKGSPTNGGILMHMRYDSSAMHQVIFGWTNGEPIMRRKYFSNAWQPWKYVAFTSDLPT